MAVRKRIARRNPSPPLCPSTVMRSSFVLLDKDLHKGEAYQKKDKKTNNNISRIPSRVRECTGLNPCARRAENATRCASRETNIFERIETSRPGRRTRKNTPLRSFSVTKFYLLSKTSAPRVHTTGVQKREKKREKNLDSEFVPSSVQTSSLERRTPLSWRRWSFSRRKLSRRRTWMKSKQQT